jgi:hypothetical protein
MGMKEFLTFQTFITPTLLICIYYVGVLLVPLLSWILIRRIEKIYLSKKVNNMQEDVKVHLTFRQRFIIYMFFIISLLCMEIMWRIMLEFFIAYFDMHDALMKLSLQNDI